MTHYVMFARLKRWYCVCILSATITACSGLSHDAVPESTYIPDANYHLLMAEIAVQKKEFLTAAEQYLNSALLSDDAESARRATEFATDYGYDAFALSAARHWLELEPESRAAQEHVGQLYLRRYDTDRAYAHLSALPGDPPENRAFLALGEDLAGEENTSGVTTVFKRLVLKYPDSVGLQLALARAAMRSGDYDLALLAAGKAGEPIGGSTEPQFLMAQALMAQGNEFEALALIERLRTEPESIAVELEYVRLLSAGGRMVKANQQLANLARIYGTQPDFVRIHGLINLAAGDLDLAERNFENLLSAGQNVYECMYYLGRISVLRGAYQDGIDYFARIRGGAYLLPAQIAEARAYQELGQWQAGLDGLHAFARDYPRHAMTIEPTRANLLFDSGERQQSLGAMDDLMNLQPDSVELLLVYGAFLDLAGELDRSLVVMRRAVELAPMDANALNTLGYTLANRTQRHNEAYRLIRQSLELEPDSPAIIDSMGWVLYRLGRYEEARSYLELAYSLMEDPEVTAHLAELLWMTGEPDSARILLERSLGEYPDNELLLKTQARLPQ
jgi:Flp pilus assembly protein TadD